MMLFVFWSGYRIDVGRAFDIWPRAEKLLAGEITTPSLHRAMVNTAIIMDLPVKG